MPPSDSGLSEFDKHRLSMHAFQAKEKAYHRHSDFSAGAALLCTDGQVITGCSVDNAAYGVSTCAEQVAIVKAVSEGRRSFAGLAIVSDLFVPITPCGACRQVLAEFCDPRMPVLLLANHSLNPDNKSRGMKEVTIDYLLPFDTDHAQAWERRRIPDVPNDLYSLSQTIRSNCDAVDTLPRHFLPPESMSPCP
ncbi:cytidine deaminase-like protein [Pleurotus eryngii]|uniref:cytidine deaminase n=1 Tax=Pleurotus eryngii TaxID=5323 RepID=A0A9P6DH55_PLEER|nr:cytidine deaminase-like protein [Pleurotus eryngii]